MEANRYLNMEDLTEHKKSLYAKPHDQPMAAHFAELDAHDLPIVSKAHPHQSFGKSFFHLMQTVRMRRRGSLHAKPSHSGLCHLTGDRTAHAYAKSQCCGGRKQEGPPVRRP